MRTLPKTCAAAARATTIINSTKRNRLRLDMAPILSAAAQAFSEEFLNSSSASRQIVPAAYNPRVHARERERGNGGGSYGPAIGRVHHCPRRAGVDSVRSSSAVDSARDRTPSGSSWGLELLHDHAARAACRVRRARVPH